MAWNLDLMIKALEAVAAILTGLAAVIFGYLQYKTAESKRREAYHKHYEFVYEKLYEAHRILFTDLEQLNILTYSMDIIENRHTLSEYALNTNLVKKLEFESVEQSFQRISTFLDEAYFRAMNYLPQEIEDKCKELCETHTKNQCKGWFNDYKVYTNFLITLKPSDVLEKSDLILKDCYDSFNAFKDSIDPEKLKPLFKDYLADSPIHKGPILQKIWEAACLEWQKTWAWLTPHLQKLWKSIKAKVC